MRDAKRIRYFQQAVLLALAMPACGGSALVIGGSGDGGDDGPGPGGSSGGSSGSSSSSGGSGSGGSSSGGSSSGASSSGSSTSSSGGVADASEDVYLPATPCNWSELGRNACSWSLSFTGDPMQCVGFIDASPTPAQCLAVCGTNDTGQAPTYCYSDPDGGTGTLYCQVSGGPSCFVGNGGRRPGYFASLGFGPPVAGRELGTHFARAALMEAGSVEAFRMMRDELVAHGAPLRLVRAASRAMRDERRHVRQTSALARRFGEQPLAPPSPPARTARSLEDLATENAIEGCIRETYSALECLWQAETAADPVVRATMKRIARDEMRHLDLAWSVHAWARGRLSAAARDRLRAAQHEAVAVLSGEVWQDPHRSLTRQGGLPTARQSQALIASIEAQLAA